MLEDLPTYSNGTIPRAFQPIDLSVLEGRVCYGGLDLASTTGITAFVLVFPPETGDKAYVIAPWFWIPQGNLTLRANRDHVP